VNRGDKDAVQEDIGFQAEQVSFDQEGDRAL
jgi:hypothetical protein